MRTKQIQIALSDFAILICLIVVLGIHGHHTYWRNEKKIIESDVNNYYAYLPATFIYQDLSLQFASKVDPSVSTRVWFEKTEDGGRVIKTTMGVAYLYFPFFIVANQLAGNFGYEPNGYTTPYVFGVIAASIFYLICGLFFIKRLLKRYVSEWASFWTILIIGAGTNIVNYVTREAGMSHSFSFFLISVFIYGVDSWTVKKENRQIYFICFILGMITLIRPINILVGLFPLLYGVNSKGSFLERIKLIFLPAKELAIKIFLFFLPIIPQLLYWKYNTGSWVFNSYVKDETFFFTDPKIIDGLFSFRKGWLLYTPLMTLSILGIIVNLKKHQNKTGVIGVFLLIMLFVAFSWWCWWYGGSFGARPLIDFYGILAIPIALVLHSLLKVKWITVKVGGFALVLSLIIMNQIQAYQYRVGLLHYDGMNQEVYWQSFLKTDMTTEEYTKFISLKSKVDYDGAKKGTNR